MKLKTFFRMLTVEQLQRVADATKWRSVMGYTCGPYSSDKSVCLLCHASGNRYERFKFGDTFAVLNLRAYAAEDRYMKYARNHGEDKAGWLMAYMARAELARRTLSALKPAQRHEESVR